MRETSLAKGRFSSARMVSVLMCNLLLKVRSSSRLDLLCLCYQTASMLGAGPPPALPGNFQVSGDLQVLYSCRENFKTPVQVKM